MTAAYEGALHALDLKGGDNSIKEIVARKIVEVTQTGERDPKKILVLALSGLGLPAAAEAVGPVAPPSPAKSSRNSSART